MKQISMFFLMLVTALMPVSCSKVETEITRESPKYQGDMTVEYEGSLVRTSGVSVQVEVNEDAGMLDIKMLKVKFVPQMPVKLDILIPSVKIDSKEGDTIFFSGEGIVPIAMGGKFEKFTVTGLEGKIVNASPSVLSFSLNFGEYPTSYVGTGSGI